MGLDILGRAEHPQAIALAGRVPVKVSMENGEIRAGDLLTLSSTEGIAMRSTKAGVTLGRALEDSSCTDLEDDENCMVLIMVNTSYSTGALLKVAYRDNGLLIDEITSDEDSPNGVARDTGRALLAQMIQDKNDFVGEVNVSEIFTDRVVAGLEIIAPRVVADSVVTNEIEAVEKDITVLLGDNGKFVIDGERAVSIDSLGNAMFAGVLQAQDFEIGSSNIPGGITMYDRITGAPSCILLEDGELVSTDGKCAEVQLNALFEKASGEPEEEIVESAPQIRILGNNPAHLEIGDSYLDPGAMIENVEDSNLGIDFEVNGIEVNSVSLDTSTTSEHSIIYRVTRADGTQSVAERIVFVGTVIEEEEIVEEEEVEVEEVEEEVIEEVVVVEEIIEEPVVEVVEEPIEEVIPEEVVEEVLVVEELIEEEI